MSRSKHAGAGLRRERMQSSPHARGGHFRNLSHVEPDLKGLAPPIAAEFVFKGAQRAPKAPLPAHDPLSVWKAVPQSGLRVTWLGHSTLLLEVDGLRILTDPVFGERASPVSFMGPKRFHPVPVQISELPPIDVLLLSHDVTFRHHLNRCSSRVVAVVVAVVVVAIRLRFVVRSFHV